MAFPTTSVLDTFTRADAGNLGANWTAGIFTGEAFHNVIVSNHVECDSGAARTTSWWNVAQFGPDCEAYLSLVGDDNLYIYCNVQAPGTAGVDGYEFAYASGGTSKINRIDNGVATQLGAGISISAVTTDQFGLENIGGVISFYKNGSSPENRSDSTYGTGYIGGGTVEAGFGFDNFGGGTLVSVPAVAPTLRVTSSGMRW